jgi:glutaminyl-tRNA synthetase
MAVLKPLKVVIDNYPERGSEELEAVNNPEDASAGTRSIPFSGTLFIEREDFLENPPKEFFRLSPGREVRLRYAYIIKCVGVTKDPRTGEVTELHCTYDPQTRSGGPDARRKVKATIHWVSAAHALDAEVRLYNPLLKADLASMSPEEDWTAYLNPQSLERLTGCLVEPSLKSASPGSRFQFERLGYFSVDPESTADHLVFNRTVSLKDAWARLDKRQSSR